MRFELSRNLFALGSSILLQGFQGDLLRQNGQDMELVPFEAYDLVDVVNYDLATNK